MKKRMFAALLAVIMVFALSACTSSSSSTTTVTTSVTDSEGNTTTTTNTTTTESGPDGVTTTHETTEETTTAEEAEAAAPEEEASEQPSAEQLAEVWHERYWGGAKGTSKDGDEILFAFDDLNTLMSACLFDITDGGNHLSAYEGEVYEDEDGLVLDNDSGSVIHFTLTDNGDDTLTMTFLGDGDEATLTVVDEDTIVNDMAAVWADFAA